ncbi:diacylglycerol kinase [Colwellia sp. MB02u-14]|nr:diacylglycerol kinase [Colwellia sp. MB02u-14]
MNSYDNITKPKGLRRIYLATLNSLRALKWLYDNKSTFKQELLLLLVVITASFVFDISIKEQVILILAIVFVIFTERINTAIEAVIDSIGLEINPLSGLAINLGAAVMLSLLVASCIWLIV